MEQRKPTTETFHLEVHTGDERFSPFEQAIRHQCELLLSKYAVPYSNATTTVELLDAVNVHHEVIGKTIFVIDIDGVFTRGTLRELLLLKVDPSALALLATLSAKLPYADIVIATSRPSKWLWRQNDWVSSITNALSPSHPMRPMHLAPHFFPQIIQTLTDRTIDTSKRIVLLNAGKTPLERMTLIPFRDREARSLDLIPNTYFQMLAYLISEYRHRNVIIIDDNKDERTIARFDGNSHTFVSMSRIDNGVTGLVVLQEAGTVHRQITNRPWFRSSLLGLTSLAAIAFITSLDMPHKGE